MSDESERQLLEQSKRSPFWVCVFVFGLLALEGSLRLNRLLAQRDQMAQAQQTQTASVQQMAEAISQVPAVEAKLQALSVDLIRVASTNATAAQIVREFNVQWTPGKTASAGSNAPASKP